MNIEDLCKNETPVTVWIGDDYKIEGIITKVGVMPGHMARIGFSIRENNDKITIVNEPCTIRTL